MHARHHDVEAGQQLRVLVERTVFEDVDLDAGEDAERGEVRVQRLDHLELAFEPLGVETVGDGETGAVVGEGQVLVTERGRRLGHLRDGASAVGPVGMAVAVAAQQTPEAPRRAR